MAAHLRSLNVDPESVAWDAWRREDGRWSLIATFEIAERSGTAELTFDAPGNYVTLDNEDARWLVGELIATAMRPARPDDLRPPASAGSARSQPTYDDAELPLGGSLGDDAIDLVSEQPVEAFLDTEPPTDEQVVAQEAELREEAADAAAEEPEPARRRSPGPPARQEDPRPGLGPELGRDHVRRRRPGLSGLPRRRQPRATGRLGSVIQPDQLPG